MSNRPERNIIPNFNDPKAVVREYSDSKGELYKIEVFYGGVNGGDSAGHGHWVAEKIDDLFQVVLDRNPDKIDGGKHYIENNKNIKDAYNEKARLDRIRAKENIISELSCLNADSPSLTSKVKELRNRFFDCGSCGHEDNVRLKEEFESIANRIFEERKRKKDEAKYKKEYLLQQAENLSFSTDYKYAKEQIKNLQEQWKQAPRASKEDEDYLWARFKNACDKIYENSKREYEERKRKQAEAKQQKENLLLQAESLVYSSDLKAAKEKLKSLQEQWKQVPRASKEDEDNLWSRFRSASDRIYEKAKQEYDNRQSQYQEAKSKKESIISHASSLINSSDYRSASDEMKRLSEEFYNAGNAGKDNQQLKERFNDVKDRFYQAKKQAAYQKQQEYRQVLQDRLYQKQSALDRIESAISNKEDQLSNVYSRPDPNYNNPYYWDIVSRRNDRISQLESAIRDMQMKRLSIINQISELQSKINNLY